MDVVRISFTTTIGLNRAVRVQIESRGCSTNVIVKLREDKDADFVVDGSVIEVEEKAIERGAGVRYNERE